MTDLAQAFSEIKSMPDHILEGELKNPTGKFPGWLAFGEIHERKRMRATTGGGDPTKRQSMAEEYVGSIQPTLAGAGMQPPPPQPPQQPMPPQGIAGLPQQPEGYARGGIVGLARGGPVSIRYANQEARRKLPLTDSLQSRLNDALYNVYGPGYTAEVYSGGQRPGEGVGTHRHDEIVKGQGGRAGDVRFFDPEGRQLTGNRLAPIGQYWAAKKYGGVGMEMHGGGVHLDELTPEQSGGGWNWNYADKGGQYTKEQDAAIRAGLRGELPSLYSGAAQTAGISAQQRALLDAIAAKESGGGDAYRKMYGGDIFKIDEGWAHPGQGHTIVSGPNAGQQSTAAGRYQFLRPTWEDIAKRHNLTDFSPANQDIGALRLAEENYARITGKSLNDALASGDPVQIANVGKVLSGTWTSLPGGIEQGTGVNQFVATYNNALANPSTAVAQAAADAGTKMAVAEKAGEIGTTDTAITGGSDPMSQLMMASTFMGKGSQKPAAAPPAAPVRQAVAVDPRQFRPRHGYVAEERRLRYG